ncbi:hypothetical protein EV360DRAFT_56944, partial [Lentinula raphanica]
LDGTFGICSSRLLLFIALAVDEEHKGVPIALFLFSACTKARATHASYDTAILTKLLCAWKTSLVHKFGLFEPRSCITDTDTKERGAIIATWPHIILLICRFHLRQCWTNHRKKLFRFPGGEYWKDLVRNTLNTLKVQLISSVDHASAVSLIESKRVFLQNILASYPEGKRAAEAGLQHFRYLDEYWMKQSLWQSWSEWGRLAAAAAIKIPVEGIIPTTNHLESFNMVLKKKYIQHHLHSGHRLRFDLLIILLITEILPKVYSRRRAMRDHTSWLDARFFEGAGGQNLSELQQKVAASKQEQARIEQSICWWSTDINRDQRAQEILVLQRLHSFASGAPPYTFTAICSSSQPNTSHSLKLGQTGEGCCTCRDFYNKGGACKHLRAFRLIIDGWASRGLCNPFYYPSSLPSAREIKQKALVDSMGQATQAIPPAILLKEDVLEQWVNLQALAQDRTIFGGPNEDQDTSVHSGLDEEEEQSQLTLVLIPLNLHTSTQPDLENLFHEQRDAVDVQIGHRITQEVVSLIPRLRGLETLMVDATALTKSPQLLEFNKLLQSITSRISAATIDDFNGMPASTIDETKEVEGTTEMRDSQKRRGYKRTMLRAPSPEENQKRKKSHGTL